MNCEKVVKNIRDELTNYISTHSISSLVIGVSGGIDSALCCALAKPVCEKMNIPLIGVSIPIESNKEDEIIRARSIGKNFCDHFTELDLTEYYKQESDLLWRTFGPQIITAKQTKIANGNIKARMRMRLLYFVAGVSVKTEIESEQSNTIDISKLSAKGVVDLVKEKTGQNITTPLKSKKTIIRQAKRLLEEKGFSVLYEIKSEVKSEQIEAPVSIQLKTNQDKINISSMSSKDIVDLVKEKTGQEITLSLKSKKSIIKCAERIFKEKGLSV
jgi:hypothetical protein